METKTEQLDLRGVACPMNFVKTKLFLDKMPVGSALKVILDAGEPIESVHESMTAEGHQVCEPQLLSDGAFSLLITKSQQANI